MFYFVILFLFLVGVLLFIALLLDYLSLDREDSVKQDIVDMNYNSKYETNNKFAEKFVNYIKENVVFNAEFQTVKNLRKISKQLEELNKKL